MNEEKNISRRKFIKQFLLGTLAGSLITSGLIILPPFLCRLFASKFIYKKLSTIDDIRKWSKLGKPVPIGIKGKQDIYRGLIFSLFEMREIEDIKFNATSVLWGHKTFKGDLIINELCNIIKRYSVDNPKRIQIISSTPDIEKLYNEYGKILIKAMERFENALIKKNSQNQLKFGKFYSTSYKLLLKIHNTDEFYEIYFLNKPIKENYIVQFDGRIYISKLESEEYRIKAKLFNQELLESVSFKEKFQQIG
jgi:hypothetical protein